MDSKIEKALAAAPVDADKLLYDVIAEANLTTETRLRRAMPKPSTVTKLVSFFTSESKPARTRRWAGMVLLYIVQEWNKAKEQVLKSTKAHALLGEMLLSNFAELSIISATFIAAIATKKDQLVSFWPGKKGRSEAWTLQFPLDTSSASWLNTLNQFITESRSPSSSIANYREIPAFEAKTLQLDDESLQCTGRVLRCIVSDRFVIMLAPPDPRAPLYIEVPYANMITTMKTNRVVQDSATDSQASVPVLVITVFGEPGSCTVNTMKKKVNTIHIFLSDNRSLDRAEKMLVEARDEHREPVSQIAETLDASQNLDDSKPRRGDNSLRDKSSMENGVEDRQNGQIKDVKVADTMPELNTQQIAQTSRPNMEVAKNPRPAPKLSPAVGKLVDLVSAISPEPEEPVKFVDTASSDKPTPVSRTNVAHAQVVRNKKEFEDIFAVPDSPAVKHNRMKPRTVPKKKTESTLQVKGTEAQPKQVERKITERVVKKVSNPKGRKINPAPGKVAPVARAKDCKTIGAVDDVLQKDSLSSVRHPSLIDETVVRKVNLVNFSKGGPKNQGRRRLEAGYRAEAVKTLTSSTKRNQEDNFGQSPVKRRKTVSPVDGDKEHKPLERDDQIERFEDEEQASPNDDKTQLPPVQDACFMPIDNVQHSVAAEDNGGGIPVENSENFVPIENYESNQEVPKFSRRTSTRRTRVTDEGSPFLEGSSIGPESPNLPLQIPIHTDRDAGTPGPKSLWQELIQAGCGENDKIEQKAHACDESDFSGILSSTPPAAAGLLDDRNHDPFVTAEEDETYDGPGLIQRLAATIGIRAEPAVEPPAEQAVDAEESDNAMTETSFEDPDANDIAAEMEWEQSLESRHKSILDSLCRISRRFVSHVIDCEEAIADSVDDYFRDGTVLLNELDRQHVEKLQDYQRKHVDGSASTTRHKFSMMAATLRSEHEKLRGQIRKHLGTFKESEQIKHEGRQQLGAMMKAETVLVA